MLMAMATATIVVMGNYELGRRNPRGKRDKLKCFLCDGPHMLKKCPKKFVLKEKSVGKALVLGSSTKGVEAKETENEKKPVECFLCHGPQRLRKCLKKSVIKENDGADKEPKKLGSSKEKAEAKSAKKSKKKRGLPPKKDVSLSSDLEEKVTMKIVKLGPMRLELSEASELAESSTRLPPMGKVGGASDFKEKK
ncbi:hypothetical protein Gotur_022951 [Gossypium turneri]